MSTLQIHSGWTAITCVDVVRGAAQSFDRPCTIGFPLVFSRTNRTSFDKAIEEKHVEQESR
jgi:hypothetical protein